MKTRTFAITALAAALVLNSLPSAAQTPQTQPLVQAGNLVYLGQFSLPPNDGTGRSAAEGWLTWGGAALGMGPDGTSIYYGCHDWGNRIARVKIAPIGGTGTIVEPCAPIANLASINPGDPNSKKLGGSLWWNGRLTISAYSYYDGNGTAVASHFVGTNVANQAGPHTVGIDKPGMLGGYMGVIPQEWRGLLGGPALTGQCCIAVIARSSFGPSASVFNPADLGVTSPAPSKMLVGYPEAHQTFGPWNVPNPYFTGVTRIGGLAFPAGTRTVLFVGRHGTTFCYGTGTSDPALAGKPDGQGNLYCYDPSDGTKGSHGFPYKHQVWAYDANDLLAVKQGSKQPWEVVPYGVWTLTNMNTNGYASMRSATYDPATRRLYIALDTGDATPSVHVYEISNAVVPPPPPPPPPPVDVDCVETAGAWSAWTVNVDLNRESRTRTWTQTIPKAGNGKACTWTAVSSPATETEWRDVAPPPPPPPPPTEICGDGIDNDGDGLIDEDCVEICGDKIDNDKDGLVDEGCSDPAAVPGAPERPSGSVKRSKVFLKWAPPLTGGAVTDYIVEAGVNPGQTLFSTPVGNVTSVTVPDVGRGKYYVRIRAHNANGVSVPSKEVVLSVGCTVSPRSATQLSANTVGGLVNFSWNDPDGCSNTTYTVTIGNDVNAVGVQTLESADTSATTLLTKGTYYARVTTLADTGVSQSSVVKFTVKGNQCVTPRFHTKLESAMTGRRIGLAWSPLDPDLAKDDDLLAPVSWMIEAGSAPGAADYGTAPLDRDKAFLTDAPAGTYYVRVRPQNACGAGSASNEVKLVVR